MSSSLAVKGTGGFEALRAAGAENLAGKVVIDATNPITDAPPKDGVLAFFTNFDESLMERLQREISRRAFREGVQFGWQRPDGESAVSRRSAHHVHLRR